MRRQLQGIALILAAILLALVWLTAPWIPVIETDMVFSVLIIAAGIAGLVLVFRSPND